MPKANPFGGDRQVSLARPGGVVAPQGEQEESISSGHRSTAEQTGDPAAWQELMPRDDQSRQNQKIVPEDPAFVPVA